MSETDSAASVFGLLSDPIRVDVLRAIARAQYDAYREGLAELTFSEIYDRVDVDNTSKLSYHLGELTGTFLRKDETGYSFTHAGERMVRFILAENYSDPPDFGPIDTDGRCLFCETAALEARVNHQFLLVECGECGRPNFGHSITPAQPRDREGQALVDSLVHRHVAEFTQVQRGVCPMCAGTVATTVEAAPAEPLPETVEYLAVTECTACLRCYNSPLSYTVAHHPASVAFHWDHGVDITAQGLWTFHRFANEGRWTSEQVETDPSAYEVILRYENDELRARLDDNATITHTERVRR